MQQSKLMLSKERQRGRGRERLGSSSGLSCVFASTQSSDEDRLVHSLP